jgi:hypothetical protein
MVLMIPFCINSKTRRAAFGTSPGRNDENYGLDYDTGYDIR